MNSLLSERGRSVASLFISVRWLPLSSISLKADYGDDEERGMEERVKSSSSSSSSFRRVKRTDDFSSPSSSSGHVRIP